MLKRILSVAIASISGASIAQTSVTIYGIVDVAAMGTNQSGVKNPAGSQYGGNTFNLNNNSSLMGFKGAEDLGQGLKGIFQAETAVNITGNNGTGVAFGTGSLFPTLRDSYVGLTGPFGSAIGGYVSPPVRQTLASAAVMPGATGPGDITKQMTAIRLGRPVGSTQFSSAVRATGVIYAMPTRYGIDGSIMYSGSNNNGTTNTTTADSCSGDEASACSMTPQSIFGFNLGWTGYGVSLKGAFQQATNRITPVPGTNIGNYGNYTTYLLTPAYTGIPGLKVAAIYARNSLGTVGTTLATPQGAGKLTNNQLWAGVSYRMGRWEPRFAASWSSDLNGSAIQQLGARQWTANLGHFLSERTQVYGVVSNVSNSANQTFTLGLQTSQLGTSVVTSGSNLFTYGLGLRTSF